MFTDFYRQCERAREEFNLNKDDNDPVGFEASAAGAGVAERKQIFDPTRQANFCF